MISILPILYYLNLNSTEKLVMIGHVLYINGTGCNRTVIKIATSLPAADGGCMLSAGARAVAPAR